MAYIPKHASVVSEGSTGLGTPPERRGFLLAERHAYMPLSSWVGLVGGVGIIGGVIVWSVRVRERSRVSRRSGQAVTSMVG